MSPTRECCPKGNRNSLLGSYYETQEVQPSVIDVVWYIKIIHKPRDLISTGENVIFLWRVMYEKKLCVKSMLAKLRCNKLKQKSLGLTSTFNSTEYIFLISN